jgi:hypothetical protein
LIDTYVECATDLDTINENMVNPLFDVILSDYNMNADIARDPEVLNAIATLVNKLGVSFSLNTIIIPSCILIFTIIIAYDDSSHFNGI